VISILLSMALSQAVPQENCAELLDAGVPAPVVRLEPGTVIDKPLYAMTPARTCYLGQEMQACTNLEASQPKPLLMGALVGGGAVLAVLGVVAGVAAATGHLGVK
jgi:hypothetical protein